MAIEIPFDGLVVNDQYDNVVIRTKDKCRYNIDVMLFFLKETNTSYSTIRLGGSLTTSNNLLINIDMINEFSDDEMSCKKTALLSYGMILDTGI